jgi:hypothetical protein
MSWGLARSARALLLVTGLAAGLVAGGTVFAAEPALAAPPSQVPAVPVSRAPSALPATVTGEQIISYDVRLALRPDASMHVTEKITYDFAGSSGKHGIQRFLPVTFTYDAERNRVYPLSNVKVTSPSGAPTDLEVIGGSTTTMRVGDPNRTVDGVQTYLLDYDLAGVVNTVDGGQQLYWNATGDEWEVPIAKASVAVTGPAAVQRATCYQGPAGSTQTCMQTITGGPATYAATSALGPGEGLTVVAGFPAGTFPRAAPILREKWSPAKAFTLNPVTGVCAVALLGLLAGGAGLLAGQRGRDQRYLGVTPGLVPGLGDQGRTARVGLGRREPVAVQFTPPRELRAGELGTLIDEKANVVDVTATIIDLAVRGYLRIEELGANARPSDDAGAADAADDAGAADDSDSRDPSDDRSVTRRRRGARQARFARMFGRPAQVGIAGRPIAVEAADMTPEVAPAAEAVVRGSDGEATDWVLVSTGKDLRDLRSYELALYGAIFKQRSKVTLSALKTSFSASLAATQKLLYAEVTERGWFRANPRTVRWRWYSIGIVLTVVGLAVTVLLAIFTHWALLGLALLVSGPVVLALAGRMPARTASGTALLAQARGFRLYLETAEADQIRFEEGQDVFSRYLPYAIVFGVAERWASLFAQLAASGVAVAAPTWYIGGPYLGGPFDYGRFGGTMSTFSAQTSSTIQAATPSSSGSSGFSGGFSGGGGGGGGGGSW